MLNLELANPRETSWSEGVEYRTARQDSPILFSTRYGFLRVWETPVMIEMALPPLLADAWLPQFRRDRLDAVALEPRVPWLTGADRHRGRQRRYP
jgi:hypothetical protein